MKRHTCYKCKKQLKSEKFSPAQFARLSMICRVCESNDKKLQHIRKKREKEKEDVYKNMFFDYRGL